MAMDKDRLGTAIWTAVKALYSYSPSITPAADAAGLALWKVISDQIILEIQGHAVVTSTTSTPGAQTGASTLPGTATGTVA